MVTLTATVIVFVLCACKAQWSAANKEVDARFINGANLEWCKYIPENSFPSCQGRRKGRPIPVTTPTPGVASSSTEEADAGMMADAEQPPPLSPAPPRQRPSDTEHIIDPAFRSLGNEPLPADRVMSAAGSFEGDILGYDPNIPPSTDQLKQQSKTFITDDKKKWPKATVVYVMSPYFRPLDAQQVRASLQTFTGKTGVQFKVRTVEADYLYIGPGIGCQSFTGQHGGQQLLSLQMPACKSSGVIHHQLMHAVGFYHEQSRTDRDRYVEINWENIAVENHGQFQKYTAAEITAFGEEYDYRSLMHFGQYDFALDPGVFTIRPRSNDTNATQAVGQRVSLSAVDVIKIKLAYPKFDSRCPTEKGWVQPGDKKCYFFSFQADKKVARFAEARNYCRLHSAALATEQPNSLRYIYSVMESSGVLQPEDAVWIANCKTIARNTNTADDNAECTAEAGQYFVCYKRLDANAVE
ncbi:zinc metalloproteinase nas-15-like [Paramacrobiotus metropolitanus]|uniref:zinc metalloproteinase nas-15-like n=1 Tax=Paramacrobiotus metropolitanus TaxID=2943436 RepID=UPI00244602DC|nr:zinc metalloproteinase nas-15-like [Paramacrobiotus metropolitanus]